MNTLTSRLLGAPTLALVLSLLLGACASDKPTSATATAIACTDGQGLDNHGQVSDAPTPGEQPDNDPAARTQAANHHLARAFRHLERNELGQAEQNLLCARKKDPTNPWVRLNMGVLRHRQGLLDAARAEYEQLLQAPRDTQAAATQQAAWVTDDRFERSTPAGIAAANLRLLGLDRLEPRARAHILTQLETWRLAWQAGNADAYTALYAPGYQGNATSRSAWLEDTRRSLRTRPATGQGAALGLGQTSIQFEPDGQRATVTFVQTQADTADLLSRHHARALQFVRQPDNRWLIDRESAANP